EDIVLSALVWQHGLPAVEAGRRSERSGRSANQASDIKIAGCVGDQLRDFISSGTTGGGAPAELALRGVLGTVDIARAGGARLADDRRTENVPCRVSRHLAEEV